MILKKEDLFQLCQVAIQTAKRSGELIQFHARQIQSAKEKASGTSLASKIVTEIDLLSQEIILHDVMETLKEYDLGLLAEEGHDDLSRFKKDYFWCIDPLDGTLQFTQSKPGYAVSIALVSKEGEALVGVVYEPLTKILYHAIKSCGVFRNDTPWIVETQLQKPLTQVSSGGSVMNACWTLDKAPAYFIKKPKPEQGCGCSWDYAATSCIFKEIGAWVSDASGNPLNLNSKDTLFMNQKGVLYASHDDIAKQHL